MPKRNIDYHGSLMDGPGVFVWVKYEQIPGRDISGLAQRGRDSFSVLIRRSADEQDQAAAFLRECMRLWDEVQGYHEDMPCEQIDSFTRDRLQELLGRLKDKKQ